MAQDWRDQRDRPDDRFRQVDPRSRGREGGDYGSYRGREGGGRSNDDGYLDRGYQGGGWSNQGAGSVSDSGWHSPDDDFRNDYGTGAGDVDRSEPRYGSGRSQPGFPSFGGGAEGGGYGGGGRGVASSGGRGSSGGGYGGSGQSDVGGYGAAYRGERVNMDRRGGLEGGGMERGGGLAGGGRGFAGGYVEPGYASGDFRGQQGAFHEERGYGNRRDDQGWWGGPTGDRPGWQRLGEQGGHQGQGPVQSAGEHRGRGPRGYRRSDQRIHDDINDRLTDDPMLDAREIDVEVKDGEVTLTGTVDSRQAKRHAEDLAESVSGVLHCQNNLRIRSTDQPNRPAAGGMGGSTSGIGGTTGETGATSGRSSGMQAGGVPAGTASPSTSSGAASGTASVTGSDTGSTGGTTNRQH
ncbi:BON domain-containing protein [Mongoliimonas terrestris]|uniref:BON domain-containing protein n=1 Tax=Mongoliimonas terrestris TaxID=1709001 RepID=UPI0009496B0E